MVKCVITKQLVTLTNTEITVSEKIILKSRKCSGVLLRIKLVRLPTNISMLLPIPDGFWVEEFP